MQRDITAMEKIDVTSPLQSRLSSLSVSSFPGMLTNNCENSPLDRLQNTDLSQSFSPSISQSNMDGPTATESTQQDTESNKVAPSGQVTEGSGETEKTEDVKVPMPPLLPPTTWTSPAVKELKARLRPEKDCVVTVYRGDIMTVHVPTVPEGKRVCWEFATDGYDIGFGIYFDWGPVTSHAITVHVSESSDDEEDDEEQLEGPASSGDVEKGSKSVVDSNLGEILPVYRQDSHNLVHGGSHEFPGEGTYLLKFDNSYSLWRNKTLYYKIYYSA